MVSWPDAWLILRVVSADLRPISNSLNKIRRSFIAASPDHILPLDSWVDVKRAGLDSYNSFLTEIHSHTCCFFWGILIILRWRGIANKWTMSFRLENRNSEFWLFARARWFGFIWFGFMAYQPLWVIYCQIHFIHLYQIYDLVVWVLCHINHCRLFNAKSSLFTYIK